MEGKPACTIVGILQAQDVVIFLLCVRNSPQFAKEEFLLLAAVSSPSSENITNPPEIVVPTQVSTYFLNGDSLEGRAHIPAIVPRYAG
jgi:hypothetical protein